MSIDLTYGKESKRVDVKQPCQILIPKKIKLKDEKLILKKAFEKPLNSESFEDFLSKSNRLLFIVNDGTRPTPTSKILDFLYPILSTHKDVNFIVATGSHRPTNEKEFRFIFGKYYDIYKEKIFVHDAKNEKNLRHYGKTSRGTEVSFNKLVGEIGNIVLINSVEPHYFAGYTGGRKSFLPGVAGYKTIEMNHKFALNENSFTLGLEGNPVHEDMVEAVSFLKDLRMFSIQIVLTPQGDIYQVTTGNLNDSFSKAIDYANEIFCVPLAKKGNIVITVASPPGDIDLYQSQKALENGKLALEKDGVIILVSQCPGGIGDQVFFDLLSRASEPSEVLSFLKCGYKLGYHKAAKIAELRMKSEIWAVTDLDDALVKKAMMKPYSNIQKAVDDAINLIESKGKKSRIIVMPFGNLTVPKII
jgi:nickel-dependent lactate racemase